MLQKELHKAVKLYDKSLRWGNWEALLRLIRPKPDTQFTDNELQQKYIADLKYLEHIRITRTQMSTPEFYPQTKEAESFIIIDYTLQYGNAIHVEKLNLHWWYDKENEFWFTETPLPTFKPLKKQKKK